MKKLVSLQDMSVNFVREAETGYFESRFVCRPDKDYYIVYLSSRGGCSRACRMCHLTATRQVEGTQATLEDFVLQARPVIEHWRSLGMNHRRMHFNFMARGEPLDNEAVTVRGPELFARLSELVTADGVEPQFLISTILPKGLEDANLHDWYKGGTLPHIYYSMYSAGQEFRKRWLPQAMDVHTALSKLRQWGVQSGQRPRIHFAFIEGQNDSEQDMRLMAAALRRHEVTPDINVVRYNPPNESSRESSEETIHRNVAILAQELPGANIKIIPRVGLDVHASCGTFFQDTI